jgi:hypothetical protein
VLQLKPISTRCRVSVKQMVYERGRDLARPAIFVGSLLGDNSRSQMVTRRPLVTSLKSLRGCECLTGLYPHPIRILQEPMAILPGKRLDPWEILSLIGADGRGAFPPRMIGRKLVLRETAAGGLLRPVSCAHEYP